MNLEKNYEIIDFNKFKKYIKYKPLYNSPDDNFIIIDLLSNNYDNINNVFNKKGLVERSIFYDYEEWYYDIRNSFKDEMDIKNQFFIDFRRSNIFINGNVIPRFIDMIEFLELNINKKEVIDTLMFCTQASLGLPYCIIQKNLHKNNSTEKYFLAGLTTQERNNNFDNKINIEIRSNIKITIEKKLRIVTFVDNEPVTLCFVVINTSFFLNSDKVFFNLLFNAKE